MARDFAQSSSQFLASIDAEIERLQNLRQQVAAAVDEDQAIDNPAKSIRRGMSEEGRRRVAEAQKARWAKLKKASKAETKAPVKKAVAKKTPIKKSAAKKAASKQPAKKAAAVKTTEQA